MAHDVSSRSASTPATTERIGSGNERPQQLCLLAEAFAQPVDALRKIGADNWSDRPGGTWFVPATFTG